MSRPRQRVRLEDGLKLDVNKLARDGLLARGSEPLTFGTRWTSNRQGVIASAFSTIQKEGDDQGSLRITVVAQAPTAARTYRMSSPLRGTAVVLQVPCDGQRLQRLGKK